MVNPAATVESTDQSTDRWPPYDGISEREYPFEPNFVDTDGGHRMHYVDEGEGHPVVMVHGNPTWSYYYRNLIRRVSTTHRTVAPDHIGCGLSDKPTDDDYDFTLAQRVDDLDAFLSNVVPEGKLTLVMHDWGGMIGMRWATEHPERIEKLVLMNTAAFPLPDSKRLPFSLWLVRNTRLGGFLVDRFNAFSRGAARFCVTDAMSDEVAAGYTAPYQRREDRIATLRFVEDIPLEPGDPGYDLVAETEQKLNLFEDHPILIGWGLKDFVFDVHFLNRWKEIYPDADYAEFRDAGHYVLEDREVELGRKIADFVDS